MVKTFRDICGAIAFYTCIPISTCFKPEFQRVARYATVVGLLIGLGLALLDSGLHRLHMPTLTRSAVVVVSWISITGGLHLDGAMDTADGLAIMEPQRRLEVMADSHTGAFGVMAAIALLLLKVAALSDLTAHRGLAMVLAAGWGRWGQQVAIARFPYLKPTGKGAFHKVALPSLKLCIPALALMLLIHGVWITQSSYQWPVIVGLALSGGAIAISSGQWFYHQLQGHTGDTYGAVVEWTEALFLTTFTLFN